MADLPLLLFLIVCGYSLWRLLGWTKSFRKRFYAERFGEAGEARSQRIINSTFDPNIYHRFHNLIIPTDNGTTQVDHLLISSFGLFIIETKAMVGWIFGTESQASWTKINYQNRLSFQYHEEKEETIKKDERMIDEEIKRKEMFEQKMI